MDWLDMLEMPCKQECIHLKHEYIQVEHKSSPCTPYIVTMAKNQTHHKASVLSRLIMHFLYTSLAPCTQSPSLSLSVPISQRSQHVHVISQVKGTEKYFHFHYVLRRKAKGGRIVTINGLEFRVLHNNICIDSTLITHCCLNHFTWSNFRLQLL